MADERNPNSSMDDEQMGRTDEEVVGTADDEEFEDTEDVDDDEATGEEGE